MIPWILARYTSDRRRLRQRASLVCPCHTGRAVAILLAGILAVGVLALAVMVLRTLD